MAIPNTQALWEQTFDLNPQFNVLICRSHRYGVRKPNLSTHLKDSHKEIGSTTRTRLLNYGRPLWDDNIRYPSTIIPAIPNLPVYFQAFKCQYRLPTTRAICGVIYRTRSRIQDHARQQHNWVNPRKRGRYTTTTISSKDFPWLENISCQQFFTTGSDQRLFEVLDQNRAENPISLGQTAELAELVNSKIDIRRQLASSQASQATIQGSASRLEPNQWLKRAGWAKHLEGFEKSTLKEWISLPNPIDIESTKGVLSLATQQLIAKAQNICQPEILGYSCLEYVTRKETGSESNEKILNSQLLPSTLAKYSLVWQRIVLYLYSTWELPLDERPCYRFTKNQQSTFSSLLEKIDEFLAE